LYGVDLFDLFVLLFAVVGCPLFFHRALAQELMEMLQASMKEGQGGEDTGLFIKIHEEIRDKVTETKMDRKRKRAQQKIVDPAGAAVYKMQRKDAKKRNRDKKKMSDGHHKKRRRRRGNEDIL
jgi:hypothetical protein